MTGPNGNSEFCFPETVNVPRGESRGRTLRALFPLGQIIKCFVIPPKLCGHGGQKKKSFALEGAGLKFASREFKLFVSRDLVSFTDSLLGVRLF